MANTKKKNGSKLIDSDPLESIAETMRAFKGDWKSPDAVTLVRSTRGFPVNKTFKMDDDGEITKTAQASIADATGIVVGVPDVNAFGTLLEMVGAEPSMCLISGRFAGAPGPDGPVSKKFRILSGAKADEAKAPRVGWGRIDKTPCVTRSLKNTEPSSWVLFDCDFVAGMPDGLRLLDYEGEWWSAMVEIFPGLSQVGRVHVPSSTSRLLDDRGEVVFGDTPSSHTWIQIRDASHVEDLRQLTLYAAARDGKAFLRRNKIGSGQMWTIFDPSTFSRERLVFEGAPTTEISEYGIADPEITIVDGGRFDTRAIPVLSDTDYRAISAEFGVRFENSIVGGVRAVRVGGEGLTFDLDLELRDPSYAARAGTTGATVGLSALHVSVADLPDPIINCQTPFRPDSVGYAGTVWLGHDRMPFFTDFGAPSYIYRTPLEERRALPEQLYRNKLTTAIKAGDENAAKYAAATLAAVIAYKGRERAVVRASIVSVVDAAIKGNPGCFLPDYDTKTRNQIVTELMDKTLKAVASRIDRDGDNNDSFSSSGVAGGTGGNGDVAAIVKRLNRKYVHVLIGKKPRIIIEKKVKDPDTNLDQYQPDWLESGALKEHLGHEVEYVNVPGQVDPEAVNPFNEWLYHSDRNTATDVVFRPEATFRDGDRPIKNGGVYNLWQGMLFSPVDPATDPELAAAVRLIEDHMLTIIAGGDQKKFNWMMDWFAALVQDPACQGLCIPVWKSREGAGKNTIWDLIFAPLFGWHAFEVSRLDQITGNFNSMFGFSVAVLGNEAIWGGDKASIGAIKTLIDTKRRVELKFSEAFMSPNYCKVLLFTNEDWYAPENLDGRRFVPFDVSGDRIGDDQYFADLRGACRDGRAAFIHQLMQRDIDYKLLRTPPGWASESGLANKLAGENAYVNWLYSLCSTGRISVPERYLTLGTYNLVRLKDFKHSRTRETDLPHMFDDRLHGSLPRNRNGVVEVEFGDNEVSAAIDVFYQSYLHFANTAKRGHRFAGETMERKDFGTAISKLKADDGRGIVVRRCNRMVRHDRFAGNSDNLEDELYKSKLYVYEFAGLPRMREAFQNLSRLDIEWGETDEQWFGEAESDVETVEDDVADLFESEKAG